MPSYSTSDIVLVQYPFTNLASTKLRPAVVVGADSAVEDLFVVSLTSKTAGLQA